jgi:hypothetical protein
MPYLNDLEPSQIKWQVENLQSEMPRVPPGGTFFHGGQERRALDDKRCGEEVRDRRGHALWGQRVSPVAFRRNRRAARHLPRHSRAEDQLWKIYAFTYTFRSLYILSGGIDKNLPMFLRCDAAADHPFADAGSALRVSLPGNSPPSTNQGFPASRLSSQERHGRMHASQDMDDL